MATTTTITRQAAVRALVALVREYAPMTAETEQAILVAEKAAGAWEKAADTRKNAGHKETQTHKENVQFALAIFHKMPEGETVTAKWVMENFPGITSGQKVGAIAKVAAEKQLWHKVGAGEYARL